MGIEMRDGVEGGCVIKASKAVIKEGGPAKIKRKAKAPDDVSMNEANPWANLE